MQHLFLQLNPAGLSADPFVNVTAKMIRIPASQTGLNLPGPATVEFLPLLGGFVGADTASVLLTLPETQGCHMKHSAAKKQRLPALLLAAILLMGALTGCRSASAGGSTSSPASAETAVRGFDPSSTDWDAIVKAARGTTVTFYGWGGDADRNEYLNTTVAQALKAQYDITLEVVGMMVASAIIPPRIR